MRSKELIFIVAFVIVLGSAILTAQLSQRGEKASSVTAVTPEVVITQLQEDGREKSETMVLLGAPPMQPVNHIDRWNPAQRQESCMACHGNESTGAPTPPKDHFYDEDIKNRVFRDNCIQCHAQQNDSKSAFNEK